jgi:hypothetical protein
MMPPVATTTAEISSPVAPTALRDRGILRDEAMLGC